MTTPLGGKRRDRKRLDVQWRAWQEHKSALLHYLNTHPMWATLTAEQMQRLGQLVDEADGRWRGTVTGMTP